jgi:hypothetical protein
MQSYLKRAAVAGLGLFLIKITPEAAYCHSNPAVAEVA